MRPASGRGRGGGGGRGDGGASSTTTKRRKLIVDLSSSGGKRGGRLEDLYDGNDASPSKILDDEVESEDDDDNFDSGNYDDSEDDDEEEEETVDAKRLRLAREYLDKMEATRESDDEESDDGDSDDGDNADDIVGDDRIDGLGKRMAKERLRRSGLLNLHILIPSRLVYSHRGYPSLLVRRKRMMPNRGLMLVGYRTTVDMT